MPKIIDRELLAGFSGEVKSYLPRIRKSFETLRADPARTDVLEDAHRLIHSVKGAASMVGLSALGHLAFLAEEAVEDVAAGQLAWNPLTSAVLARLLALVEEYLDSLHAGTLRERPILSEAVQSLRRLRAQPESGDQAEIDALLGSGGDPEAAAAEPAPEGVPAGPKGREQQHRAASAEQVRLEHGRIPSDLVETFRQEAEEILHNVGELLRECEVSGAGKQTLLDIRRNVHTLKGAAASVGLRELASLSHRMEDLLDEINDGAVSYSPDIQALLLATFDCLGDMAEALNLDGLEDRTAALYGRYIAVLDPAPAAEPEPGPEAAAAGPSKAAGDRPDIPFELMESFRAETEEHLLRFCERLRTLEKDPAERHLLGDARRSLHTIKGAANMIGMRSMSTLAHEAEDLLQSLDAGAVELSGPVFSLLFSVADTLADLAAEGSKKNDALAQRSELMERLARHAAGHLEAPPLEPLEPEKAIEVPSAPAADQPGPQARRSTQFVRVPIDRLDELVRLVSELVVNRSVFEQHVGAYSREVDELSLSIGRLKRVSSRFDSDFQVSTLRGGFGQLAVRAVVSSPEQTDKSRGFDALEFDRYTDFHLVSRDLGETTSDLASAASELAHRLGDFDSHLNRLGRLTSEVQDKLMRMRMVPLLTLSTRLHRTVRVTGERQQKPVDLVIEGEQVELDKTVLEEIAAPLEHLLRNAVDHGIESESTRRVIGKPARGQVRVRAFQEGTQVVLQVSDDGAGMEPERLREAAVRCGMHTEAEAAQLSDSEAYDLIFQPGFSTARSVSETSGRGVGMDIVKSSVNRMKGTVSIDTRAGLGTTFTIRLPLTLAIMRVLLVKAGGQTYAVPLSVVTQILRVEPGQFERVGQQPVVRVEGKVIPAVGLAEVLRLDSASEVALRRQPVLVLRLGSRQIALVVDQLEEAREVVVKTLGTLLRRVHGVMGATLMGDGAVVLIVNPADIAAAVGADASPVRGAEASHVAPARRPLDVLLVDDSVSVRRVLGNLVRNTGWNPIAAKDGLEALELLQRGAKPPDVVLLDVEMPRMDGYELLAALRGQDAFKHLPVIMVTSRAGEKHRRKAFDLGATDYLVKPYQEETLLAVIRRVVREAREIAVG